MPTTTDLPELDDLLPTVDVIDVKTARGDVSLRAFTAGALGNGPLWIKSLFAVRVALALVLRLETAIPDTTRVRPETVSFTPGQPVGFFKVVRGEEDHYLLLEVSDNHLVAYLAIITDDERPANFKVVTLVRYLRPAGRLYFTVIRPFHHLVLLSMCRAGGTSFARR